MATPRHIQKKSIKPAPRTHLSSANKQYLRAHDFAAITERTEDYLVVIFELIEYKGYARVSDIAEKLGRSCSTVSVRVKRLEKQGYLECERYRGLALSPRGQRVAQRLKHRRITLSRLLRQLGLSAREISANVEGIEHHISPALLRRLDALVAYYDRSPSELRMMELGPCQGNGANDNRRSSHSRSAEK